MWWNGEGFESRTLWSAGGELSESPPTHVDATLRLDGLYVLPPFAEGHTHTIVYVKSRVADFLTDGVFYAMVMNADHTTAVARREWFGRRDSVDVAITVAGLTASNAHPLQIGLRGDATLEDVDGDWITAVDGPEDLARKWPHVARINRDFVKLFLLYSEEYAARREDPSLEMRYRGMDPALVPEAVRRAHRDGLRVAAHVRTANDFHVAVEAGVDLVAHLPGFSMGPAGLEEAEDPDRLRDLARVEAFRIDEADARSAARRGVGVITTIGGLEGAPREAVGRAAAVLAQADRLRRDTVIHNLELLRRCGVRVLLGSDTGEGSVVTETLAVAETGVFQRDELVRMLVTTTPQSIFPNRRIGRLAEGYEASFVALGGNPLDSLEALRDVRVRFKQGRPIEAAEIDAWRR